MKFCTNCGSRQDDAATNCTNCKSVFARSCVSCGQPMGPGVRFCGACGTQQTVMPAVSEPVGERREVTVVFVDAMDFTAASNRLDSEDVYLFIDEAMRLLVEVVTRYEGTIDKFTGDGLMALFGAPIAHEDDPERAVRAAREMQIVIGPLRKRVLEQYGFDFRIRVGVNTGPVIAGTIGGELHTEYTVIGDTVNLASRLQTAADPDTVLVSSATYRRTHTKFSYKALPPLTLKGIPAPVTAFQLLSIDDESVRRVPISDVPMAGRAVELSQLQQLLEHVGQAGRSEIVALTGEAGIGKSRLARELVQSAREAGARAYVGRSSSYARSRPLWLIAAMLRDIIGIQETDPATIQAATIRSHIVRKDLDADELLPFVLNTLGISEILPDFDARLRLLDSRMLQEQTHAVVRQLLHAETAEGKPLVLIFENIQWIDPASRSFLEYLVTSASDRSLMMVLICRHAERDHLRPILETARANGVTISETELQPLSSEESRQIADSWIVAESPEASELKKKIVARADGNPLYLEEIIRMLIDRGALLPGSAGWTVGPSSAKLLQDVPATLRGLILARFDFLSVVLRRTLQKAAVVGRSFPVDLLQQISPVESDQIPDYVKELETREFLRADRQAGMGWFSFPNTVVHEAVQGTLLKRERQHLHERVAEVIAERGLWPFADRNEVLAFHYGESASPSKALPYLMAAADSAARRQANESAVQWYREALLLMDSLSLTEDEQYHRAQISLARSLKFLGRYAEAEDSLSAATRALRVSHRDNPALRPLLATMLTEFGDLKARAGALQEAGACLHEAREIVRSPDLHEMEPLRHLVADRSAWIMFRAGKLEEASALLNDVVTEFEAGQIPEPVAAASIYNTLAGIQWQRGKPNLAAKFLERSIDLYEQLGYAFGIANAQTNLGVLHFALGRWSEAASSFEESERIRDETGSVAGRAANLKNLGTLRMTMGDLDQAAVHLNDSLRIAQRLGETADVVRAEIVLAQMDLMAFQFESAQGHLDCALLLKEAAGADELIQIQWLLALVRAEHDLPGALAIALEARQLAVESTLQDAEADATRVLGIIYGRSGKHEDARRELGRSMELSSLIDDEYRRALAIMESGTSAKRDGRRDDAMQLLAEARETFLRLGAAYDVKRTDAALRAAKVKQS